MLSAKDTANSMLLKEIGGKSLMYPNFMHSEIFWDIPTSRQYYKTKRN